MSYKHLTEIERYQISALQDKGCSQYEIAEVLQRSRATISRELRRNKGLRGYRPKQAQELATIRCQQANAGNVRQIAQNTLKAAESMLRQEHSPEQVSSRLRLTQGLMVSPETLYQHIYRDKRNGGTLHQHLRCQKKRRKRYGSGRSRRGCIPNRVSIEERCTRVEDRAQIGHWEMDTMVGRNHKGFLVTMVERKSRFALVCKVKTKTAQEVADAIIKHLSPIACMVKTMTYDNGKEFAQHERVSQTLKCKAYFAHPYSSWERGTNENTNGLIRQYYPKKSSFIRIKSEHTKMLMDKLNNRPRKCLDYETPSEVFLRSAITRGVALGT